MESVKEDPDASRIAAMQFRVVIAGLAAVTRGASLFDIVDRTIKTPVGDAGALDPGCVLPAYFTVMTRPLRSALTMAPTELPVSSSTAPCWLVSTMACAPRPSAAPTFPAA